MRWKNQSGGAFEASGSKQMDLEIFHQIFSCLRAAMTKVRVSDAGLRIRQTRWLRQINVFAKSRLCKK